MGLVTKSPPRFNIGATDAKGVRRLSDALSLLLPVPTPDTSDGKY